MRRLLALIGLSVVSVLVIASLDRGREPRAPSSETNGRSRRAAEVTSAELTASVSDPRDSRALLDAARRAALSTPVPVGLLEGVVRHGAESCRGAEVHVWPWTHSGELDLPNERGTWVLTTDSRGEFQLEVDRTVSLCFVEARREGMRVSTLVSVDSWDATRSRVVLYFGDAVLAGRVLDERGRSQAGVRVVAARRGSAPGGQGREMRAWTRPDGSFQLRGLFEGEWGLRAGRSGQPAEVIDLIQLKPRARVTRDLRLPASRVPPR